MIKFLEIRCWNCGRIHFLDDSDWLKFICLGCGEEVPNPKNEVVMGDKKMYCGICQENTPHEYIGKQEFTDKKGKKKSFHMYNCKRCGATRTK